MNYYFSMGKASIFIILLIGLVSSANAQIRTEDSSDPIGDRWRSALGMEESELKQCIAIGYYHHVINVTNIVAPLGDPKVHKLITKMTIDGRPLSDEQLEQVNMLITSYEKNPNRSIQCLKDRVRIVFYDIEKKPYRKYRKFVSFSLDY